MHAGRVSGWPAVPYVLRHWGAAHDRGELLAGDDHAQLELASPQAIAAELSQVAKGGRPDV
jgi:hypothetical protein